jgi:hypothetical protein
MFVQFCWLRMAAGLEPILALTEIANNIAQSDKNRSVIHCGSDLDSEPPLSPGSSAPMAVYVNVTLATPPGPAATKASTMGCPTLRGRVATGMAGGAPMPVFLWKHQQWNASSSSSRGSRTDGCITQVLP